MGVGGFVWEFGGCGGRIVFGILWEEGVVYFEGEVFVGLVGGGLKGNRRGWEGCNGNGGGG